MGDWSFQNCNKCFAFEIVGKSVYLLFYVAEGYDFVSESTTILL